MQTQKTVGIYGGTFSPPHLGHVSAGLAFLRQLNLDRLMIMPSRIPPHKQKTPIDPLHRLRMTQLAFSDAPEYGEKLFVSDFEIGRPEISYTVNTLAYFHSMDYKLFFLCGTDMFLSLDHWRDPARIFSLATIAYVRRENESPAVDRQILDARYLYRHKYGAEPVEIRVKPLEISSSEIRRTLESGGDASRFLSPAVSDYIRENHLYLPSERMDSID